MLYSILTDLRKQISQCFFFFITTIIKKKESPQLMASSGNPCLGPEPQWWASGTLAQCPTYFAWMVSSLVSQPYCLSFCWLEESYVRRHNAMPQFSQFFWLLGPQLQALSEHLTLRLLCWNQTKFPVRQAWNFWEAPEDLVNIWPSPGRQRPFCLYFKISAASSRQLSSQLSSSWIQPSIALSIMMVTVIITSSMVGKDKQESCF